ncbi:uncharacterized protein IL334_006022 [Kwoniella shivajii]|uniref:2-dehydropantoate 2-reductase n=1 Tax=Kwoniella shivajii TaxID=564305 RepID=A0ABZ1D4R7_9TREE|nr:hypothetical protein IL334_006022 [Kwoniella shivajii]
MTRIHLLGVGSIGTLLAHNLRVTSPTTPLTLLVRSPRGFPNTITCTRDGVRSTSTGYEIESSNPLSEYQRTDEPIKSLIVTTKTTQTVNAIEPLLPRLNRDSVITLLQNGMGVHSELIHTHFTDVKERPSFILGTTPHGAFTNSKGNVNHTTPAGKGFIKWGVVPPSPSSFFTGQSFENLISSFVNEDTQSDPHKDVLDNVHSTAKENASETIETEGLKTLKDTLTALTKMTDLNSDVIPFDKLNQAMLFKLAVNASVNPITAILGRGKLTNSSLLDIPIGLEIVNKLVDECSEILIKHLTSSGETNKISREDLSVFEKDSMKETIKQIISSTSNNVTSMAVDIRDRRETEIDYINGYMIKLGKELGCKTEINQLVYDMIKFMTESNKDKV